MPSFALNTPRLFHVLTSHLSKHRIFFSFRYFGYKFAQLLSQLDTLGAASKYLCDSPIRFGFAKIHGPFGVTMANIAGVRDNAGKYDMCRTSVIKYSLKTDTVVDASNFHK